MLSGSVWGTSKNDWTNENTKLIVSIIEVSACCYAAKSGFAAWRTAFLSWCETVALLDFSFVIGKSAS